ncbi:MAG: hypothetical protein ACFCUN_00100 [Hyphomicrobiaceae bacterium]
MLSLRLNARPKQRDAAEGSALAIASRHVGSRDGVSDRPRAASRFIAIAGFILLTALSHILATLYLARERDSDALASLVAQLPINRMTIVEPQSPGREPIAFLMPEAHYAICPFDVAEQPLRVRMTMPDTGWLLSIHTMTGEGFYSAPGQADDELPIVVDVVPPGDALNGIELAARTRDLQTAKVIAPHAQGIVVVRAPILALSLEADTLKQLAGAACGAVGRRQRTREGATVSLR